MALSNYEKQKRWRENNRALYNLQQRQRRAKTSGKKESVEQTPVETDKSQRTMVEALRELITRESAKPPDAAPLKPQIFKDDYGRVISERQWNTFEEKKRTAKERGFEFDEYSQSI